MTGKKVSLASIAAQIKKIDNKFAAVAEDIDDIKQTMTTKNDLKQLENTLTGKIDGVDSKVAGINRRLDTEAMQRTDLKLPRRVHELEEEVFGTGRSKHPKHLPL